MADYGVSRTTLIDLPVIAGFETVRILRCKVGEQMNLLLLLLGPGKSTCGGWSADMPPVTLSDHFF